MRGKQLLLATVGLAAFQLCSAYAQTAPQTADAAPGDIPEVQVYGVGSTRQVQTLSAKDIKDFAPGTSPLKVIAELPGVNYTASDPYGTNEWENRLSVRGFSQSQMGFTLDDIPLGDQDFVTYNGLSITRALISENLSRASISQGAGAVDTASSSNLGGVIQFYSADPSDKMGVTGSQSFGTESTFHEYVKLDSGKLGSGTKFYVAYARTDSDKWKGAFGNQSDQVNLKAIQDTSIGKFTLFFDWSSHIETDYQDLSLNFINTLGRNVDNYYPDYTSAYNAAIATQQEYGNATFGPYNPALFTHGETKTNDPWDVSYYFGSVLRTDYLGSLNYDTHLTDALRWKTTAYIHDHHTASNWIDNYVIVFDPAPPNGAPLAQRDTKYGINRYGFLTALSYDLGDHEINAGVWYEYGRAIQQRNFYEEPLLGQGTPSSPDEERTNPYATPWNFSWKTDTVKFHLQDTWQVVDNVTVNAGFKSLSVATDGGSTTDPTRAHGSLTASRGFLPQFGANWQVTPEDELFASVAENMRSFQLAGPGAPNASPWVVSQAGFLLLQQNIRPETNWAYEVGYRFQRGGWFEGLVTGYLTKFSDRLFPVTAGPIIALQSTVQNVGGVTSQGVEVSGTVHPLPHISWYNGGGFNESTFDSNYISSGATVPTQGKTQPGIPKWQYKTVLAYDDGTYGVHLDGNWMSKRFFSYLNDTSVPDQFIFDLGGSYTLGEVAPLSDVKIQANIYNLFDKSYIATMGELGFPVSGDKQSLLAGAPRTALVTISAKF